MLLTRGSRVSKVGNNGTTFSVSSFFPSGISWGLDFRYPFPRNGPQRPIVDKSGPLGLQDESDVPPRSLYVEPPPRPPTS